MIKVQEWTEKLNKVDGNTYSFEEAVTVIDGVYEGMLQHDNINVTTFAVYTGPKLTGERLETYALSTPSLTPWKRSVRVYADAGTVYLSYETDGDTVEAEDINQVQDAIAATQEELNAGEQRAMSEEERLGRILQEEAERAAREEARLDSRLDAEQNRAMDEEASLRDVITANKPVWDDKYTRNEIDNKLSSLETAIDWKESVGTFGKIATVYPEPADGWTVNVKDTDYTYRYNGAEWVAISANAIPKATQDVDGLLAKEDKANYDDAYSKRHIHGNKDVTDKITQAMLDKLAGIDEGANQYVHPDTSGNRHIPSGGASGQILWWDADGTAVWGDSAGTSYTHPDSGVVAGTYRAVAVNAQGHVTAGANPDTLAGYGITDAAEKSHNHDGAYLKKGAITWGDLKGV